MVKCPVRPEAFPGFLSAPREEHELHTRTFQNRNVTYMPQNDYTSQGTVGNSIPFQFLRHFGAVLFKDAVHVLLVTASPTFISEHGIDVHITPVEDFEASALLAP